MGVPTLEKVPAIEAPYCGLWSATLRQLREQGTWVMAQRPLLDEYVYALKGAAEAREERDRGAEDKYAKRVIAFAEALGLTAKARKAVAEKVEAAEPDDPFAELDELEQRRQAKGA